MFEEFVEVILYLAQFEVFAILCINIIFVLCL